MHLFKHPTGHPPAGERTTAVDNEIETVIQIMERTPGHRPPIVGAPTRCPECGEWGLVDHSDQHLSLIHI